MHTEWFINIYDLYVQNVFCVSSIHKCGYEPYSDCQQTGIQLGTIFDVYNSFISAWKYLIHY